jgi:hypothetical protein
MLLTTGPSKLNVVAAVPSCTPTVTDTSLFCSYIGPVVQRAAVPDVQLVVMHAAASTATVDVCSARPKFKPDTETDVAPLCGAFRAAPDATAALNENRTRLVPATAATVVTDCPKMSKIWRILHRRLVDDVHDDVRQFPWSARPPRSRPSVAVESTMPKSRPDTVNDAYPLCGEFKRTSDTSAASKLYTRKPVPTRRATRALADLNKSPTAFERHARDVAEFHDDVKHTPSSCTPPVSSPAVAVCSPTPKSSPLTVTEA